MDRARSYHEVELGPDPVNLSRGGRLNPNAAGWTRHPIHDCAIAGRWPRKKRWNYWCITSNTHLFSITISHIDYAGLIFAYLLDFNTREFVEKTVTIPFGRGVRMGNRVAGDCHFAGQGVEAAFSAQQESTTLSVDWADFQGAPMTARVTVAYPENYETMSVVIPWNDRHFQYTSKHHAMPASGQIAWQGETVLFNPDSAFACLDFGRGVWPYRSFWNWAGGSGLCNGRRIGLNLGAGWTDGTGLTENGVVVDGVLRKIQDDIRFEYDPGDFMKPWRLRAVNGDEVDLEFVPFFERVSRSNALIVRSEVHQMIGRFAGTIRAPDGALVTVDNLVGSAEDHHARW